jgi:class 3 adenylate cyclase
MQICPSCGEENPPKFRLCGYCGTPLAPAVAPTEERRTVTIVFSDLQGSTKLGEALDPESVRAVMSRYFDAMTAVLRRHGGTIEKFIGDAIMAVFGLPRVHEDDALRAVRAARETQDALAKLNDELERVYGIRLTNRTGVNTGEVVTGDAATQQRLVTGDTVNTAARLEQAAGPNEVLIGDLTLRLVRDAVTVEPVEPLELKGKAERVPAYRLREVRTGADGLLRREDQPLVGRDAELGHLHDAFDETLRRRTARLATVIGDAGVGKSRLIREVVDRLRTHAAVVRGRCLSYGEGITFWPVVEAVRDAADIAVDDAAEMARQKLAQLLGDEAVTDRLASLLGFHDEPFSVDELSWAVRRWLEITAEKAGAVVWVIDDIHWAEPTLLRLLQHLTDTVAERSVLLLCSSRHDLLDRHPEWAPDGMRVELQPLTDADAAEVVTNLLGSTGIPSAVRDRVIRAAEGNPLFVEQLLSMLVDSGTLRQGDRGWEVEGELADIAVPPTIHALLAARLDLLGREERAVIEPAAVIGLEFSEAAVRALVPEAVAPSVGGHLAQVERKQLIHRAQDTALDVEGFRFHHILIRDAAYQNLLKRARSELHEKFVDWVEGVNRERARGGEYEEILAYHLEQAYRYLAELGALDDHGQALRLRASTRLAAAGRRAMARGDMAAAASLMRRAAAARDPGAEKAELLVDLGEALTEAGSFAEATEVLADARAMADAAASDRLAAKARLAHLATELYVGEAEGWANRVEATVASALPLFEAAEDHDGAALAWRLRVGMGALALRFGDAATAAERVVQHARFAGNRRYETRGASGYAQSALFGPTPVPDAIARCRQLLVEVESDRRTTAFIRAALAQLTAMDNRIDEGRALLAESVAQLSELGSNVLAASSSIDSARIEILAGNLEGAETLLRQDHEALSRMGERYLLPSVDGLLARVLYILDRFDEADALSRSVAEMAMDDDPDAQAIWRSVQGMIRARHGDPEEGIRLALEAIALRRQSDAPVLLADALADFSEVLRFSGRDDEERAVRNEALRLYERKGDIVSAGRLRSLLA